jgi:uncharacterized protein (TIGR02147 family)
MLPSVYTYLDYRQYFADVFNEKKRIIPSFSYRSFARMAGSTSPNLLQLITARKLNISNTQLSTLSKSLELDSNEEKYLETIVAFDHAKTHQEKDKYFQRILMTREYKAVKTIEKKQYDYFSHWYNPVVRELITSDQYPNDPAWIGECIVPKITLGKVKKSIELLQTLGLVKCIEDKKKWIYTDRTISTPSEVLSMAVIKYHQDMITLGREAIERFDPTERDIRSITIGLSEEGYSELKKRMESFWKELLAFSDTQENADQVMQVNMQLFPLSVNKEKKK